MQQSGTGLVAATTGLGLWGRAPSPGSLRDPTSPARGRGEYGSVASAAGWAGGGRRGPRIKGLGGKAFPPHVGCGGGPASCGELRPALAGAANP
jgi:hypothetical protein